MDGRIVNACIAPLVSSSDGIHAWMGRPSVMHVERMLMVRARTNQLAVRDGDSGGTVGGGAAVDVRTA